MAIKFKPPIPTCVMLSIALGFGYFFFYGVIRAYAELLKTSYGIGLADSIQDLGFIYGVLDTIEQGHLLVPVILLFLSFSLGWFERNSSNIFDKNKPYDGPNLVTDPFTTLVCRVLIACVGYVLSIVFPEIKLQLILLVIILTDLSIDIFFVNTLKKIDSKYFLGRQLRAKLRLLVL